MKSPCTNPVLIVEGPGDSAAVPFLIRRILESRELFHIRVSPSPIERQNIAKLARQNELERFLTYAMRREGDSVLLLLDADENCPKNIVVDYIERATHLYRTKRVAFGFFKSEYETLFINCLDIIAETYPDFGWNLDGWDANGSYDDVRGAKEYLTARMKRGRAYKETRDQARFTAVLDFQRLRQKSRTFRHLESMLTWLASASDDELGIYPYSISAEKIAT